MSRRRGEFEHRTSIFEGAFRAWSHLGGLDPEDLERMPVADLDPLTNPIENDSRLIGKKEPKGEGAFNPNGTKRRQYPYEPLPRSGLAHPYVQAILSPWLGPDADNDAIQLGLTTLRTWWQHRRKGESGSAIAALGTEKMKGVVEGYTRHFFTLSHCLIVNDKEQPPRSLHSKMKELEKVRSKRSKKRSKEEEEMKMTEMAANSIGPTPIGGDPNDVDEGIATDLTNDNLSPLERLHIAQQRQLAAESGMQAASDSMNIPTLPIIQIKNRCVPGKPDLPAIVEAVNHAATQLAHSGRGQASAVPSSIVSGGGPGSSAASYGDPDSIPIVYVTENGDAMIAMSVDGITCAHCVKIVETVLRGCNGNKSPIDGLLDAAADRMLCAVLILIDRISSSKRIVYEAARNLAMVGYTAKAKVMSPTVERNGEPVKISLDEMFKAFEVVGQHDPRDLFDWSAPCSCPDNGVARDDCARHGQMTSSVFDAFDIRGMAVHQCLSGGQQLAMQNMQQQPQAIMNGQYHQQQQGQQVMLNDMQPINDTGIGMGMDIFGGGGVMDHHHGMGLGGHSGHGGDIRGGHMMGSSRRERNPSIISFGNRMSLTGRMSEVSYGRAMSGLSALSIDWENMDDFDINVDHSAHINNGIGGHQMGGTGTAVGAMGGYELEFKPMGGVGGRRSSMRQPLMSGGPATENDAHVSFKI